ncbi:MAG: class I SAM-dependent methyltransferase [Deltaproteobacteria bacterium]|nr:class I SAM-dependent methyltransferase [Deltaproteobacteria bacterium]
MRENEFYNTIWKRKSTGNEMDIEEGRETEALKLIGKGDVLLDVGCGRGRISDLVKDRFNQIIGLDISLTGLSLASKKMTAIQSNLNQAAIPLKDQSVDAVVCLDVIEHLFDPLHLVEEAGRVLKDNGEFILSTPNTRFIGHISNLLFRGTAPKTSMDIEGYDGGHLHYFTFADLKEILTKSNFSIVAENGFSMRFYNSNKLRLFYLFSKLWEKEGLKEFFCQGLLIKAKKEKLHHYSS